MGELSWGPPGGYSFMFLQKPMTLVAPDDTGIACFTGRGTKLGRSAGRVLFCCIYLWSSKRNRDILKTTRESLIIRWEFLLAVLPAFRGASTRPATPFPFPPAQGQPAGWAAQPLHVRFAERRLQNQLGGLRLVFFRWLPVICLFVCFSLTRLRSFSWVTASGGGEGRAPRRAELTCCPQWLEGNDHGTGGKRGRLNARCVGYGGSELAPYPQAGFGGSDGADMGCQHRRRPPRPSSSPLPAP